MKKLKKHLPNIGRITALMVLRILPILFPIAVFIRTFALETGDSAAIFPMESTLLILIVFLTFGMGALLSDVPGAVRVAVIIAISGIPAWIGIAGGMISKHHRTIGGFLLICCYLLDAFVSSALFSPVALALDIVMVILTLISLYAEARFGAIALIKKKKPA